MVPERVHGAPAEGRLDRPPGRATAGGLPLVTVIMPVRDEAAFIARSLGAVLAQDYPADRLEVLVADGRSTDGTRELVRALQARHPNLRLIDNPGRIVPPALNAALGQARGEVVVRVDGHCEIRPQHVRRCVELLRQHAVDGVGGPGQALGETPAAQAIAVAMSSPFGVGDAAFRTVTDRTMLVDTIPFPAYRRAIIERAGPFDEELVRDEDDEYNYRLRKMGGKLLLAADIPVRYYGRRSLGALWRQYFEYGFWKVRVLQKHPRQMRPRQFAPPTFAAMLLGVAGLAPVWGPARALLALVAGTYAGANLAASVLAAGRGGWRHLPRLPLAFAALHLGYGFGFLAGLVQFRDRWGDDGAGAEPVGVEARTIAEPSA